MMACDRIPFRLVALTLAFLGSEALGQAKARADRTPLTFRDCGLYCNYGMWHGIKPETEDTTNMLPASRAASADSPWTFYIMQYHAPKERRPDFDGATIREMAKNGKKVILRAGIGRMHKNPKIDEMERRLVNMFEEVNPDWLYAITLDEEQIYWHGWGETLAELYHRCKKRWPDLPVYQWWSPMEVPNVSAKSGWVALPADGWVIDLYGRPREEFEKKVVMSLETAKPLIHIAWASPDWPQWCGAESWDKGGRKIFDDQLEICRAYNVPVAYFCTQKSAAKDGKRIKPIRWGWHAVDPLVRAWYRELEAMVMNLGHLPASQIGFRTADKRLFEWAHGSSGPSGISFSLDDGGGKRFAWRPRLGDLPVEPGEHVLESQYAKLTLTLDDSASKLDGALAVRSIKGYPNRVPLVFRIEPKQPLSNLTVTAHVTAVKVLGGRAHLSVSIDGIAWSEPICNDPAGTTHELAVNSPVAGESDAPLWIRITLEGLAGKPSGRAASLSLLEVAATFEPAL